MHDELYADYYKHPGYGRRTAPRTPIITDEWSYNRGYAQALLDFGIMEMLPDEE